MSGMLKLKLQNDEVVEGTVFAIDPVTQTVVLYCESSSSYRMISPSQITSFQGDSIEFPISNQVSESLLRHQNEDKALKEAEKKLKNVNLNASREGQQIFDQINFVFESEWKGDTIVINKTYRIRPPYDKVEIIDENNSKNNNINDSYMTRLIKALEVAKKKVKNTATTTTAAATTTPAVAST